MITNTPALRPCNGLIGREKETKKRSHEKHEPSPKLGQNELLVRSREGAREVGGKMALRMTWLATTNPFHLIKKKISS